MPANMPIPTVAPMLSYEDAGAALVWLAKAFGFRERTRITMPDGSIGHAELEIGDGIIMLAEPDPHYQGPKRHAETCEAARRWSAMPYVIDGVHVYVDDVDAHFGQARQAGRRSCPSRKTAAMGAATVPPTWRGTAGCSPSGRPPRTRACFPDRW